MSTSTISQLYLSTTGASVADLSSTTKLVTDWLHVGVGTPVSVTFEWPATGTFVGVFGIEGSNDYLVGQTANLPWILGGFPLAIDGFNPAPVQPAGPAGDFTVTFDSPGEWIRATSLRTSGGTGTTVEIQIAVGA